ncbi:DUF3718 domain-containing protein [Alteromonas sp. 14N.309.X.WAT.G.H12]|uniref:DUF3718 domain-containing protein n=1 Tax=Alteromonas sp. 14N.309.X.WAT.G.H12 TaxID=3120824 RepID=UPI002FD6CE34
MKVFTRTMVAIGLSLGVAGLANAGTQIVAADDSVTSEICVSAATGSKYKLKSAMEKARVDKEYVLEKLTCNGMSVIEFVEQHGTNPSVISAYITNGGYSSKEYLARMDTAQ